MALGNKRSWCSTDGLVVPVLIILIGKGATGNLLRHRRIGLRVRRTPSVGQDLATIKWDSGTAPYDTKTGWSEPLLSFSSSSAGWPWKTSAGVR